MMKKIRLATIDDAQVLLDIYSPYILDTPISFETEVPSLIEFEERIAEKTGKFPWLVCETDEGIAGYAYAGPFRARAAYAWTLESSVYVRRGLHGRRIGAALYDDLLARLKKQGAVNVIGGITLPNEPSRKFHERFGFVKVGHYKDAGFKFGKWWDIGHWQLQLQKPEQPDPLRAP